MAAPHRFANVHMSGDGRVGYLHATAPTPTRKGSKVLRLREDTACGVTIDFSAPLEPQMKVKILFSTGVRREIDRFESTYGEILTEATLKKQNEQHGQPAANAEAPAPQPAAAPVAVQQEQHDAKPTAGPPVADIVADIAAENMARIHQENTDAESAATVDGRDRLPLKSDSKEQCLRVWKNDDGTLEVSAIRAPKFWDTGRIACEGPQMYRFDVLVDNRDVPLQYHFQRDPLCKPRSDSGGGMFYAGSLRMKQWKGPPTGPGSGDEGGGDAPAGICATAIAVPTSPASLVASPRSLSPDLFATAHGSVHPEESPIDVGEEHLVFGEPAEQLVGLPLVDWTLTPEQVRVMSLL